MNSTPALDLGMKRMVESGNYIPAAGKVEDLKFSCPPRLRRSDLDDPARFHLRLVEWLMQQK